MLARNKKRVFCLLLTFTFIVALFPASVSGHAPTFTDKMKQRFVEQIIEFAGKPHNYAYYALHDFDGDGIPELLMGRNNREEDPLFVYYAIWKYDMVGDRFVHIGSIEESRYLMKDKYSNALIAIYADVTRNTDAKAYFNYYITDSRIERNTMITRLTTPGVPSLLVYDTMFLYNGYHRNDIAVDVHTWNEMEINMLGTYDEVIVHDWRGFDYDRVTATVAVNSWRPHEISRRPKTFSSADRFTRAWQMPMYELIMEKLGPADTLIKDSDLWEFNLWQLYGQKDYMRFALHDVDGCGVPELLLGWRYLSHFSWDVYKWWNNDMRYVGSFDSYAKYMAEITCSGGDIFTFDPVPNEFFKRSAKRISIKDNMLQNEVLLAIYDETDEKGNVLRTRFLEGTRYNTNTGAANPHRNELVNFAGSNDNQRRVNLINRLSTYAIDYREIKTFDIYIVPPSAALIMYVKTLGFTQP